MYKELITTSKDGRIQMIRVSGSKIECFKTRLDGEQYIATKKVGEMSIIFKRDLPAPIASDELLELEEPTKLVPLRGRRYNDQMKKKTKKIFKKLNKKHPIESTWAICGKTRVKLIHKYPLAPVPTINGIYNWVTNK